MTIEQQLKSLTGPAPDRLSDAVALGTGVVDGYDLYPSPVGEVAVAFNPLGVSALGVAGEDFFTTFTRLTGRTLVRAEAPAQWGRYVIDAIEAGTPGRVPVDLRSLTPFQTSVLMKTAEIPKGQIRPYGWVAKELGSTGAVRAVGSALARNPIPLMIPCHRVVRSDGRIGEYSLIGPHVKAQLLEREGAMPGRLV